MDTMMFCIVSDIGESELSAAARRALLMVQKNLGMVEILYAGCDGCDGCATWTLRIEPLARLRPGHDGRLILEDWQRHWQYFYQLIRYH